MYFVGPHVSIAGGLENAPANAKAVGATGFGMFVKNQRQWKASIPKKGDVENFRKAMTENGYEPRQVLPHAGYLINLANPDDAKQQQSLDSLVCELKICETLGLTMLNLHPGSSLKLIPPEAACDRVAEALNRALAETAGVAVVLARADVSVRNSRNWPGLSKVSMTRSASASASTRCTPSARDSTCAQKRMSSR